jgi:hypothetical protein
LKRTKRFRAPPLASGAEERGRLLAELIDAEVLLDLEAGN